MIIPLRNFQRFYTKLFKQPGYAINIAVKRLKTYLIYFANISKAPQPEALTFFLTYRCNLRCKMCGQWGEKASSTKLQQDIVQQELSLDDYKKIITDISHYRPSITLFGGEPLLHPDSMGILAEIKKHHLHALMITNGALLNHYAEKIVEYGLDELNISIDGTSSLHDRIRGKEGLFDTISQGVEKINCLKKSMRKKYPIINIQCTISSYNYKHLTDIGIIAEKYMAASITFHNLIFLSPELYARQKASDSILNTDSSAWEGFINTPDIDSDIIYKQVEIIKKTHPNINIDMFPNLSQQGLKEYYTNPSYKPHEYPARCISPWLTAYIFPDGSVRPCLNSQYSFGNIKDTLFKNIWNNNAALKMRTTLLKNKLFPACVRCTEMYRY